jgi:predicted HTH transcriptional regulator
MPRPVRPSVERTRSPRSDATKLEKEESIRLVLELSPTTRRNLRVRAAQEDLTIKDYILRLLKQDGVECAE